MVTKWPIDRKFIAVCKISGYTEYSNFQDVNIVYLPAKDFVAGSRGEMTFSHLFLRPVLQRSLRQSPFNFSVSPKRLRKQPARIVYVSPIHSNSNYTSVENYLAKDHRFNSIKQQTLSSTLVFPVFTGNVTIATTRRHNSSVFENTRVKSNVTFYPAD